MKPLKFTIPMILLILLEVIIGILMLVDPMIFWREVLGLFDLVLWLFFGFLFYVRYLVGIFIFVMGIVLFIRYLRNQGNSIMGLLSPFIAIILMVAGVAFILFSDVIMEWMINIFFGDGLIYFIIGLYKLYKYFQAKKAELAISGTMIISSIMMIIIAIINATFPVRIIRSALRLIGAVLLLIAVIDVLSVIIVIRKQNEIGEVVDEV